MFGFGAIAEFPIAAVRASAPADTLQDNFDDNSFDTVKWYLGHFEDQFTVSAGTASEVSGRVEITLPANLRRGYGYISANYYDMTDNSIFVKVTNTAGMINQETAYLAIGLSPNIWYKISRSNTSLAMYCRNTAGSSSTVANITYDATNHAWWKIRYQASNDTFYFDTAPLSASDPPAVGDWVNQGSAARNTAVFPILPTSVKLAFGRFNQSNLINAPATVYFDGFNMATTPAVASYIYRGASAWLTRYKGNKTDAQLYKGPNTLHP